MSARYIAASSSDLGDATRRERRSDRRSHLFASRGHCASLSRPGAVQAGACLRGILPLLLPILVMRPGESADPIGDHTYSPVEGIVHRYPDRVLFKLVHVCAVYCRFCFRREMVGPGKATALEPAAYHAALGYIRSHREIWEVILTG